MDTKNLAIVRQSFANTVFTHQVQEIASAKRRQKVVMIKVINIVMVGAVLFLLAFQTQNMKSPTLSYIGLGLTIAEIFFLIVQLTFDFEQQSLLHKNSAHKYMGLRDRYRLLITDIMNERISQKEIIERRNALQQEYQSISDLAPATEQPEFDAAQERLNKKGVVKGEQFTWSDIEIDHFLPEELRLKKAKK